MIEEDLSFFHDLVFSLFLCCGTMKMTSLASEKYSFSKIYRIGISGSVIKDSLIHWCTQIDQFLLPGRYLLKHQRCLNSFGSNGIVWRCSRTRSMIYFEGLKVGGSQKS